MRLITRRAAAPSYAALHPPLRPLCVSATTVPHQEGCGRRDARRQGDVVLKPYVANVCFKGFRRFKDMLQVFHMDVAKVDWDVASVSEVCRNFLINVSSISDVCCKCFI